MKPLQLDLSRDLPKVREQFGAVIQAQQTGWCEYSGPCVIGAMVPPHMRSYLDNPIGTENATIGGLIRAKLVSVPSDQTQAFRRLQRSFDSGDQKRLERSLRHYERKYLGEPA